MLIVGRNFTEKQLKEFKKLGATYKGLCSKGSYEQYEIDESKYGSPDLHDKVMEILNDKTVL